ncbi:thioredoxin-like protein [Flagelloscypha sp. PMI_526]|nr:thioredoxin-like protein [Flagelloscypha sp. PMI_526]
MSAKSFVDTAIAEHKVAIFSKSYCPYCKRTKALFADKFADSEPFIVELDHREDGDDIQSYIKDKFSHRTVPAVFVGQELIGGNDDTQAAFRSGVLEKKINA